MTLDRAIDAFCDREQVRLLARSSDYRTPPWGVEDQPPFVNLCIAVETTLTPHALLAHAQAVERAFGRDRPQANAAGGRAPSTSTSLPMTISRSTRRNSRLPHPRLFERAFVLVPLAEIAPDRLIAGTRVRDALARSSIPSGDRKLPRAHELDRHAVGPRLPWQFVIMTEHRRARPCRRVSAATREQWRKLVEDVLKGAPFDKRLVAKTYDGLRSSRSTRGAAGKPVTGRTPGAAWAIMQRVDHPDPAAANAEALHDLENGATGLFARVRRGVGAYGYGLRRKAEGNRAGA